jgi:plastocyanin
MGRPEKARFAIPALRRSLEPSSMSPWRVRMSVSVFDGARPLAVGLALVLAAAGCGAYEATGLRGDPIDTDGADPSVNEDRPVIRMYDSSAAPGGLTITAGTAVEWKNVSSQTHSVSNYSTHPQEDTWEDALLGPGGEFSHVFSEPGEYGFVCIFHQEVGYITVLPADPDDMMDTDMDTDTTDIGDMSDLVP